MTRATATRSSLSPSRGAEPTLVVNFASTFPTAESRLSPTLPVPRATTQPSPTRARQSPPRSLHLATSLPLSSRLRLLLSSLLLPLWLGLPLLLPLLQLSRPPLLWPLPPLPLPMPLLLLSTMPPWSTMPLLSTMLLLWSTTLLSCTPPWSTTPLWSTLPPTPPPATTPLL